MSTVSATAGEADIVPASLRLSLYRTMVTIREFELAAVRLLSANRLPGGLHTCVGQEACAAGVCAALDREDTISTTHRGHGHLIAKGADLRRMMAELFGRSDGYAKGRAGSMHISDAECGILAANGIVGGGLPMAVGAAYAAQILGTGRVTAAFFGEGAVAEGAFHESMTLAALWALPVVFVCENNSYAEMGHVSLHMKDPDVFRRAEGYGVPGVAVDGNDAVAVFEAAAAAEARARSGGGPTLLECKTYRWRGHFEGDPQRYRSPEEVARWMERDPIVQLGEALVADGSTRVDLDAERSRILAALEEAIRFAEASPVPGERELFSDVYAETHSEA
ncbi:MAG: thiamine pyrophosphate-dependent dehydrogenase E1 component subunit alpha [Gemmatimonadetes bacterium]|nr:thiamine pyrophosphate-dependent dehydrogenase E1 component subunit alpha [Gemmatimonadota bacterium]